MKKRNGFTLIELLVVISIIALLLSILMPSLRKVKEQARKVVCSGNLRQHSLVMMMYSQQNNDTYPLYGDGNWMWDLDRETVDFMLASGSVRDLFYCPSFSQMNCDVLWNFNYLADGDPDTPGKFRLTGYFWLMDGPAPDGRTDAITKETIILQGSGNKTFVKKSICKRPSEQELVVDCVLSYLAEDPTVYPLGKFTDIGVGWSTWWRAEKKAYRTCHLPSRRDGTKAAGGNIGFVDGHVDWRGFDEMEDRYTHGGAISFWW